MVSLLSIVLCVLLTVQPIVCLDWMRRKVLVSSRGCPSGIGEDGHYDVPEGTVFEIAQYETCKSMISVHIPDSVTALQVVSLTTETI